MKNIWRILILLCPVLSLAAPARSNVEGPRHLKITERDETTSEVPSQYNYKNDKWQMYISNRCTDPQKARVYKGVAEAGYLANAIRQWKPKGAFQNVFDLYMGTDSRDTYAGTLTNNIVREWIYHNNDPDWAVYGTVYCDEQDSPWKSNPQCSGGTGAYTWTTGFFWLNHFVVLCPNFFSTTTKALSDQIATVRANTGSASSVDSLYWNVGSIWLHETFHWSPTRWLMCKVTNPHATDYDPDDASKPPGERLLVYGSQSVADMAKSKGSRANSVIADAYTIAATASFLMQTFDLSEAPGPSSVNTNNIGMSMDVLPAGTVGIIPENASLTPADIDALYASDYSKFSASQADIDPNQYAPLSSGDPTCTPGQKKCNYISSCGTEWMPVADFTSNGVSYTGYQTAVTNFCGDADGEFVAAGYYYTEVMEVGLDQGKDPSKNGKQGWVNFEVHNSQKDVSHQIVKQTCINNLMKLASQPGDSSTSCYGTTNKDTKGGTWQIGTDQISYHALGSSTKPNPTYDDIAYEGPNPLDTQ